MRVVSLFAWGLLGSLGLVGCGAMPGAGESGNALGEGGTGGESTATGGSSAGAPAAEAGGAEAGGAETGGEPGQASGAGGASTTNVPLPAYEPCAPADYLGAFTLELGDGFSRIGGRVDDGPPLAPPVVIDEADGCQLLEEVPYECDEATEECRETPAAADAGTVSITGLGPDSEESVSMSPGASAYYQAVVPAPPHPAFVPGAEVEVVATGAVVGGFRIQARGVDDLVVATTEVPAEEGASVVLTWTAAPIPYGKVKVLMDIGHHGGSPAEIVCHTDDDGELEIPAELVSGLFEYGVWGYPKIDLLRRSVGSVSLDSGCVELALEAAPVSVSVVIDGVVSCDDASDCEPDQSCEGLRCL